MADNDAMFNEEATLLRLQDQTSTPLSALQAEVARMSGFIKEAFRNHEKQIDETKKVVEEIARQGQETKGAVEVLKGKVAHIEERLERSRTSMLWILSPIVGLMGLMTTIYFAYHH